MIGRGGESINRIRQESRARIDIKPLDSMEGFHVVTIAGVPAAMQRAQQLLREKLGEVTAGHGGYDA